MMKKLISVVVVTCVVASSMCAFAGSTWESYSTTVGKLNGSGYTAYQTKKTTGASCGLQSVSVGADYVVDVRSIDNKGNSAAWARNVSDNDYRAIDGSSKHTSGSSVRLQFSNKLTTPVNVQVSGTWRSN